MDERIGLYRLKLIDADELKITPLLWNNFAYARTKAKEFDDLYTKLKGAGSDAKKKDELLQWISNKGITKGQMEHLATLTKSERLIEKEQLMTWGELTVVAGGTKFATEGLKNGDYVQVPHPSDPKRFSYVEVPCASAHYGATGC